MTGFPGDREAELDALRAENAHLRRELAARAAHPSGSRSWKNPDVRLDRADGYAPLVAFEGRLDRTAFVIACLAGFAVLLVALVPCSLLAAITGVEALGRVPFFLVACAVGVFVLSVQVRRMHDFGASAWWLGAPVLLGLVGIALTANAGVAQKTVLSGIELVWFAVLALTPGSAGTNRFGVRRKRGIAYLPRTRAPSDASARA